MTDDDPPKLSDTIDGGGDDCSSVSCRLCDAKTDGRCYFHKQLAEQEFTPLDEV